MFILSAPNGQVLFKGSYLQCKDESGKYPHLECDIHNEQDEVDSRESAGRDESDEYQYPSEDDLMPDLGSK